MALAAISLVLGTPSAYALSTACTTLNAQSGTTSFSRSFPASSFNSGESVAVTFNDNGSNVGNSNPSTADSVILRNPTTFATYYDYRSNTGSAGSHAGNVGFSDLAGGLFISVKAGTYLGAVTITCGSSVSSDASLSNLIPSSGTLAPTFSSGTDAYNVAVANNTSSMTFTPTATDGNATITVNGNSVVSGSVSPVISLNEGPNTVSIMGTAQDGSTTHIYTITVTRAAAAPIANNVSATVAANSSSNPITLSTSGATPTSVAVTSTPLHGTATAVGTSIAYTPAVGYSGTDSFTYTASNASGTSPAATVTITIVAPTLILSPASGVIPPGQVGLAYSQSFNATGGTGPYHYVGSGIPAGLNLDASSGALSGTPNTSGTYNLSVTVTDHLGATGTASYTLNIGGGPVPVANPVSATVSANASGAIALSLAGGSATSVAVASAAAHGTAVASGTSITYTPVFGYSGTDSFTYTATNASGTSPAATVNLTVTAPTLVAIPAAGALPGATVGTRYTQSLSVSGGSSPYRFSATGLPSGLSIDASAGTISGTPSDAGTASISVQVVDALGVSINIAYSLSIGGTLPSGADRSASLYAGQAVTVNLADGISGGPFTGAALVDTPSRTMGQASLNGLSLTFAAAAQASGAVIIRYTLSNRWGVSQPIALTLQVTGRSDPSKDQEVIGMLGAQAQSAARFARAQIDNFNDRLEQLHDNDNRRATHFNLQLGLPQSRQSRTGNTSAAEMYQALSSLQSTDNAVTPQQAASSAKKTGWLADENVSVWSGGYVNVSDTHRDDVKFDSTMVGASAGIDYRFFDAFTAGIGFGYGKDSSDIGSNDSRSKGTSFSSAIYGSFHPGRVFIDGLLGYSNLSFDSRRYVTDSGGYAKGSRDGNQFFGSLSSGYEFRDTAWLLAPYGRVDVSSTTLDGFRETGSDNYNLAYADQRLTVMSGAGGLRGQYGLSFAPTAITLRGRVEYSHTFSGDSTARVGYADISDSTYAVSTVGQSDNTMTVALGADFTLPSGLTTGVTYQGSYGIGDDSRSNALMLRLGSRF